MGSALRTVSSSLLFPTPDALTAMREVSRRQRISVSGGVGAADNRTCGLHELAALGDADELSKRMQKMSSGKWIPVC